jgi:hypothetical protein
MSTDQLIAITGTIAIITDGPARAYGGGGCTVLGTGATTFTQLDVNVVIAHASVTTIGM